MKGYIAFVKKEFVENLKNYRFLILFAIFAIFGMSSALSALLLLADITHFACHYEIEMLQKCPNADFIRQKNSWNCFIFVAIQKFI